jgi:hypothetical protein
MRFFVSSVVTGFEEFREAAVNAIRSLGHEVIRSEDFAASPATSQIACLAGIRDSDAVIVLLGDRYGSLQASGKSPTHEEFEAAKDSRPVFAFIQAGTTPEPRQKAFIDEVRDWSTGRYTARFNDTESLRSAVTTAVHRWEVESASTKVDPDEMASRALSALPQEDRHFRSSEPTLSISIVGAPRQSIFRPSKIEDPQFQRELQKLALFGDPTIFDTREGIDVSVEHHSLKLRQPHQSISLSEEGSLVLSLSLPQSERGFPALIEEDIAEAIFKALKFSGELLDGFDSTERLSRVAAAVALNNSRGVEWRTRAEHEKNPSSMRMMDSDTVARLTLSPPDRSRASFRQSYREMSDDFTVLLRRQFQS